MKIGIIGTGNVGSAVAFELLHRKWMGEIVLLDTDTAKSEGEMQDLTDAGKELNPFVRIKSTSYKDLKKSDYVIISAGLPRKAEQTMDSLERINTPIMMNICESIYDYCYDSKIIVVTNPAEKMKLIAKKYFTKVAIPDYKLDKMRYLHYKNWKLVKNVGQRILELKGYTNWAVATAIVSMIFNGIDDSEW